MSQVTHPSLDDPNAWVPYRYHVSKAAAIIFLAAFCSATVLHMIKICRKRTWYFIPLAIGGVFETVGYLGRVLSADNPWALGPYIMQSLLLLLAPALFAASIYIILGRVILFVHGERYSIIRPKWLTKLFVTGDVISFLVQCGGGGIQAAGSLSLLRAGEKIIIVGLFLQLAFFGFFVVVASGFHYRFVKAFEAPSGGYLRQLWPSKPSIEEVAGVENVDRLLCRRQMMALYAASTLIMVRSVFRVIEYLQGNDGYLLRHEYFLYIFDAVLMLGVMAMFLVIHPAEITQLRHHRLAEQNHGLSSMTSR